MGVRRPESPRRIFKLLIMVMTLLASSVPLNGLSQPLSQPARGHLGHVPCDARRRPTCPDFVTFLLVSGSWQAPSPGNGGLVGFKEEYAKSLGAKIDVFWFKPEFLETDDGKLQSQAL